MDDFRFEQLDIWKDAMELSIKLFDIADLADEKKLYKFAEQLRAAGMSISNNIAEGSGSFSDKDFANFLNISRRSLFECANILHIFERRLIINLETRLILFEEMIRLSKRITNFRKTLISTKTKMRPELCALCPEPCALCPAPLCTKSTKSSKKPQKSQNK